MPNVIMRAVVAVPLALVAVSCTKLTTIGWSGAHEGELGQTDGSRHASEVVAARGELLQPELPELGDIDGDGLDDFILMSWSLSEPRNGIAYLFYGRTSFPEQLKSEDADATFAVGMPFNNPLGDVNGDGFADFALGDVAGYELIFGGPERFTGHHDKLATGTVRWTYESKQTGIPGFVTQFDRMVKLGDTNRDGYDDFVLQIMAAGTGDPNTAGIKPLNYVIMGRKDGWPSGAWDPSWAAADFGEDPGTTTTPDATITVIASGDLDGDGFADIIANGWERQWLFYGSRAGFSGTLSPANADAELYFGRLAYPLVIGDLDADGADDIATFWLNDLSIFYGTSQRWSGRVEPKADLKFYDQGSYNDPLVGDLNSDGHPDLLFVGNAETKHWDDWPEVPMHLVVYQVKGTGERLTGPVQLSSSDIYQPIGYSSPAVLDTGGFNLHIGGDLDGDRSSDLIVGAPGQQDPADSYVLLLPGAARTPD